MMQRTKNFIITILCLAIFQSSFLYSSTVDVTITEIVQTGAFSSWGDILVMLYVDIYNPPSDANRINLFFRTDEQQDWPQSSANINEISDSYGFVTYI